MLETLLEGLVVPFTYSVRLFEKGIGFPVVDYTASRISSVGNPVEVASEAMSGELFGDILKNGTLNIGVDWGDADAIHQFAEAKNGQSLVELYGLSGRLNIG